VFSRTRSGAPQPGDLIVGGLTRLTSIDYPGKLAAVVFCQGCPWRCGYCQNGDLIPRRATASVDWNDILGFLQRRRGLLDGVVFSGGEPTLQAGLAKAVDQVRSLGFQIGLHTAGTYPERLTRLLPRLDWVALDIKAPRDLYDRITGVPGSGSRAWRSAALVINSGVDYEIRTTVHPRLLSQSSLRKLAGELHQIGARHYRLQPCIHEHCLAPALRAATRSYDLADDEIAGRFDDFVVRQ
jgi:pyruvate formate lyase activating enzyme